VDLRRPPSGYLVVGHFVVIVIIWEEHRRWIQVSVVGEEAVRRLLVLGAEWMRVPSLSKAIQVLVNTIHKHILKYEQMKFIFHVQPIPLHHLKHLLVVLYSVRPHVSP
jgi:hypothetical protein